MRKLKRISDGKIFDCNIICSSVTYALFCVYFEDGYWHKDRLSEFVPADSGKDY